MEPLTSPQPVAEAIRIDSHLAGAEQRSLAEDVLDGLTRPFKELPPKHFYDARGAELFDRICELPEYYPTRAEREILEQRATEIARLTSAAELVELGSGTASKTRVLLDALHAAGTLRRYIPVDVTESMVRECAQALTDEYPGLRVHGVIADFERHLDRVPPPAGARIVAFLGGTIGNFPPGTRRPCATSTCRFASRRARSCVPRSARSSPTRESTATSPPPGSSSCSASPTATGCSRFRWLAARATRRRDPATRVRADADR